MAAVLQAGAKDVIASSQGQILANDVAVEDTEVIAQNGRIYTLSGVLVPPSIMPILPHRCDESKREMKLVRKPGTQGGGPGTGHTPPLSVLRDLESRVTPWEPCTKQLLSPPRGEARGLRYYLEKYA